MKRRFHQVDVFSAVPLKGNPLAVVHAAKAWTTHDGRLRALDQPVGDHLPAAAHRPGADYRVRIFTPFGELPFAGHPTLGSCWAWLAAGGQPRRPAWWCSNAAWAWCASAARAAAGLCGAAAAPQRAAGRRAAGRIARALGWCRGRRRAPPVGRQRPRLVRGDAGLGRRGARAAARLGRAGRAQARRRGRAGRGDDTAFEVRAFVPAASRTRSPAA
jgi:hypothetical protein